MKKRIGCLIMFPIFFASGSVVAKTECSSEDGPYLSFGIGLSKTKTWKRDGSFPDTRFRVNPIARLAVGSQFSTIRVEFEPSYARGKYVVGSDDGSVAVISTLGNIYFDLPLEMQVKTYSIAPYVGAGIGYSNIKVDQLATPDQKWRSSQVALAYQGIAGGRLALSEQVGIQIEYRFFETQKINSAGNKIKAHSANVGLTYRFF